jgi:hypothetical protein
MTDLMGAYYVDLKKTEEIDKKQVDSSCTDISTIEALRELKPKCPLKLKEFV